MVVAPVRLNHVVLFVADLDRATRFYTEVFGLELVAREAKLNAAFLRSPRSGNHHDLGLFATGRAREPDRHGSGLYHFAWQLDTIDELIQFRQHLIDAGACTGQSSHGATKSVYGIDPDGNAFELMWMLPRQNWGAYANAGVVEPLDLDADVARWSGVRTAGRVIQETSAAPAAR